MTQDEIIEMARQASATAWCYMPTTRAELEAFAKLVAKKAYLDGLENGIKAEREACLKIAENKRHAPNFQLTSIPPQNGTAVDIANLIRERGEA